MKICPKCKRELLSNAVRCAYCGTWIKENQDSHVDMPSEDTILNAEESDTEKNDKTAEEPCKYCATCGKKISINAKKCLYCGSKCKSIKNDNNKKSFNVKRKFSIIIIAAVIAVVVIVCISKNSLSKYEKLVYKNALTAQDMMKDPDSFKLGDICLVIDVPSDSGSIKYQYTIMDYSSNNVFGVPIQDTLIFKDEDYVLSYNDSQNYDSLSISKITSAMDTMQEVSDLLDDDSVSKVKVDSTRIKRKMGIK